MRASRYTTGSPRRAVAWRAVAAATLAGALALTTACGGDNGPTWQGGSGGSGETTETTPPAPKLSATVTSPAADATDVPAAGEDRVHDAGVHRRRDRSS